MVHNSTPARRAVPRPQAPQRLAIFSACGRSRPRSCAFPFTANAFGGFAVDGAVRGYAIRRVGLGAAADRGLRFRALDGLVRFAGLDGDPLADEEDCRVAGADDLVAD